MAPEFQGLARWLIVVGALLAGAGLTLLLVGKLPWLGRLPGDIVIRRDRFSLYMPLGTCLLLSLLLSLIGWILTRWR